MFLSGYVTLTTPFPAYIAFLSVESRSIATCKTRGNDISTKRTLGIEIVLSNGWSH